jgi:hypothetical protein
MSDQPWRIRTELVQGPPGPGKFFSGSASWTPGTIGAGASVTKTVAVVGSVLGQSVVPPGFSLVLPAGVLASGQVTAPDVVTVTLTNFSASPVTIGAGTVSVAVAVP